MEKPIKEDGRGLLVEAMLDVMSGGKPEDSIYCQEARGQSQLVMSDSIPTSWGRHGDKRSQEMDDTLRQLGFEIGDPFVEDPLFRPAKLPDGWTKSASSHSMHSDIIDADGFHRIGVFYKAAFYDRRANLYLKRRVSVGYGPRHMDQFFDKKVTAVIAKGKGDELIILASFSYDLPCITEDREGHLAALDAADDDAADWINTHYPNHMDPLAYWGDVIDGERFVPEPR